MSIQELINNYFQRLKKSKNSTEIEAIKNEIDALRYSESDKTLSDEDKLKIWEGIKKKFVSENLIRIKQQNERGQESLNFCIQQKTDNAVLLNMIDEIENNIKKGQNGNR